MEIWISPKTHSCTWDHELFSQRVSYLLKYSLKKRKGKAAFQWRKLLIGRLASDLISKKLTEFTSHDTEVQQLNYLGW